MTAGLLSCGALALATSKSEASFLPCCAQIVPPFSVFVVVVPLHLGCFAHTQLAQTLCLTLFDSVWLCVNSDFFAPNGSSPVSWHTLTHNHCWLSSLHREDETCFSCPFVPSIFILCCALCLLPSPYLNLSKPALCRLRVQGGHHAAEQGWSRPKRFQFQRQDPSDVLG